MLHQIKRVLHRSWQWLLRALFMPLGKVLRLSWRWLLLSLCIPAGFIVKYLNKNPIVTFVVNFVAIIPLSLFLDEVADEMHKNWGGHQAMTILATFG